MASRLAQLTLVDFMFIGVATKTTDQTQAALEATHLAVSGHRLEPERRSSRRST